MYWVSFVLTDERIGSSIGFTIPLWIMIRNISGYWLSSVLPRCTMGFVPLEIWVAADRCLSNMLFSDLFGGAAGVMAALSAKALLVASAGDMVYTSYHSRLYV
jgi:hypothetical protein